MHVVAYDVTYGEVIVFAMRWPAAARRLDATAALAHDTGTQCLMHLT